MTACIYRDTWVRHPRLGFPACTKIQGFSPSPAYCGTCTQRREAPPVPDGSSLLISGGIGDFFVLESHWSEQQRRGLKSVAYATRAGKDIRALLQACPEAFPGLREHWTVYDQFNLQRRFIILKDELYQLTGDRERLDWYEDWSIAVRFPEIRAGRLSFSGSSFLRYPLADISRFVLPDRYIAVHPFSLFDEDIFIRNFDSQDWQWLDDHLARTGQWAVLLGQGNEPVSEGPRIFNLIGQTTILEAVEILKAARGFVGCSSSLSVLAAQLFGPHDLIIKGTHRHIGQWRTVYYAPHKSTPFLRNALTYCPMESYDWEPAPGAKCLEYCRAKGLARELDAPPIEYGPAYFQNYQQYDASPIANALNSARVAMVRRHYPKGPVLDVGIGAGRFMREVRQDGAPAFGYDVNPVAVDKLRQAGQWADPYEGLPQYIGALTFWDSLEHLRQPGELLGRLPEGTWVFLSMPIFKSLEEIPGSKHRKPGEHWTYWTRRGLCDYMSDLGYDLAEVNDAESRIGRESILSFAFRRTVGP